MIIAATIDVLEKVLPPAAVLLGVLIVLIVPKFRKGIMESLRAGQRAGRGASQTNPPPVAQETPSTDINFNCSQCGQKLVVEKSSGGASVNCPSCSATLVVPMQGLPPMPSPAGPPVNAGTGRKTGGIILTAIGGLMLLAALSNGLHDYNLHSSHDVSKFLGGLGLSTLVLTIGLMMLAKSPRPSMSVGMRIAIIAGFVIGGVLILATVLSPVVNAARARARMMREQLAAGKVVTATDGSVEVTVPFGWSAVSNLHPEARLQVARPDEKEYLEVITDKKRDVPGMTLDQFAAKRRAWTVKQLTSPIEHAPVELQLNGHRAIQIVVSGICPGRETNTAATYLLTCVEDSNRFHEILAWTATSQFDSDRPDLEKITATFKSHSGNTSSTTAETHPADDRQRAAVAPAASPATHAPPPVESPLIGGAGGGKYRRASLAGEPVVGFHFALSTWQGKGIVKILEPLFKRPAGATADNSTVVAREGYVVGGLEVDGEKYVDALRVIFVRRDGDRIDATDHYQSDWIGVATGRPLQQLGGHGEKVVGVYGHKGMNMDAIGLLFAPPKD